MSAPSSQHRRVRFASGLVPIRLAGGSTLISIRAVIVVSALLLVSAAIGLVSLAVGRFPIGVDQVIAVLLGAGEGMHHTIVVEWRLPRALSALVFGAALGVSGAIFQSLTRNPLGSPDIIGFASGSYTGALIVIMLVGGGYLQIAFGALLGGCLTAGVVYLLAYRGGVQGFRLIIVGIAVSAMLMAFNTWMLMTVDLEVALSAATWGAGTLNGIGWNMVAPACIVIVLLLLVSTLLSRPMHTMELGDDSARALGIRTERVRLSLVVLGVALTAVVTAAAGPISFIALAAPQIARRLTGSASVTFGASAALGAALLGAADFLAQNLAMLVNGIAGFITRGTVEVFATDIQLPVGVMTVSIGGLYLIWLIVRESRARA